MPRQRVKKSRSGLSMVYDEIREEDCFAAQKFMPVETHNRIKDAGIDNTYSGSPSTQVNRTGRASQYMQVYMQALALEVTLHSWLHLSLRDSTSHHETLIYVHTDIHTHHCFQSYNARVTQSSWQPHLHDPPARRPVFRIDFPQRHTDITPSSSR